MSGDTLLKGPRYVLDVANPRYPDALKRIGRPPERLYVIGDLAALAPGLAVIGARKATPYGISCARRFARLAAEKGVNIISGGARGCDSEAHRAALEARGRTVVFLGGGCDDVYPPEHFGLFQRIIDSGGAVASEKPWSYHPMPFAFRERNRLIAGLADAVLIVEAGLPSGTFSTADEALDAGKEVLVVPGSIVSPTSRGSNRLLCQGATPVVDDETFEDALFRATGALKWTWPAKGESPGDAPDPIIAAICAEPLSTEDLYSVSMNIYGAESARERLMERLVEAEAAGLVARGPGGKWAPVLH